MEIPSYASNIQPYGSQSGIKIASENDNAKSVSLSGRTAARFRVQINHLNTFLSRPGQSSKNRLIRLWSMLGSANVSTRSNLPKWWIK